MHLVQRLVNIWSNKDSPPVPTSGESGLETPRHREFQQARRECGGICNSGYPSTSSGQARIKNAATVSWRGKQPEGGEVLCVVPSPLSLSIPPREVLRDFSQENEGYGVRSRQITTCTMCKDLPPAPLETQRHGEDEDEKTMFHEFS